jgi:hypothetical protein
VLRYGHCNFRTIEALAGFALLVLKVSGQELSNAQAALPDTDARVQYQQFARDVHALR